VDIEQRLSDVLSEFARTLVTDFPIQAILDQLVVRIVDVLPITGAGVTMIAPDSVPRYVAASDDAAMRFEQIQSELGEGPCLTAYQTGEAVAVADLRGDERFPVFSPRALSEGLEAVFTFPLRQGDRQLGALDLYRSTPGRMDPPAMTAAQTLADVAAAYLTNAQARSDMQASTEHAQRLALHDALTGLPNRTLLVERLDRAILRCHRSERVVAVLFTDLDRFKAVNDTYGHHIGDELLVAVADRLTAMLRPGDTLGRLGGDEFVMVCEDLDGASHAEAVAARIGLALSDAFFLAGDEVKVSASVGIAFAGRGGDLSDRILKDADAAMYQVKRSGGNHHGVVAHGERRPAKPPDSLNQDLRGALGRGELSTEYQPIVAAVDGRIIAVEALLRWAHPTHGNVAPEAAVRLAEQSGLITEVGRWVLERACIDRHRWARHGPREGLQVAVNVSAHQLMAPGFPATVAAVLAETHTDPTLLILEMTESVFINERERALVVLNDLKRLGVSLALDDFGTGFSSLSYLKQFPVDIVKIDRTFIADIDLEPASRLIVRAVVTLAHGLDMTIVAEGVESAGQCDAVTALDCEAYQGFFFSRPASADQLDELMATGYGMPQPVSSSGYSASGY